MTIDWHAVAGCVLCIILLIWWWRARRWRDITIDRRRKPWE